MNRRIKCLILVFLLAACGCTADYNLNITNNSIEEDFKSTIYKTEIPSNDSIQYGIETDDQLTPFIEQEQYPFHNNNKITYDKDIVEEDDYRLVNYKYTYSLAEYKKSQVLNKCFDNYKYSYKDNINFEAKGEFYCLYSDSLNINITTKNKVLSNNADSIKGNTYTWRINKNNVDNINIKIKIERNSFQKKISKYIIFIIIGGVLIVGIFVLMIIKTKKHMNNKF